jgi:hypothetical protein
MRSDRLRRSKRPLGPLLRHRRWPGPTSTAASESESTCSFSKCVDKRKSGTQGISIPRVRPKMSPQGCIASKRARADFLNSATHPGELAAGVPLQVEQHSDAPNCGPLPRQDRKTAPPATRQRLDHRGCCLQPPLPKGQSDDQSRNRNRSRPDSRIRRWSRCRSKTAAALERLQAHSTSRPAGPCSSNLRRYSPPDIHKRCRHTEPGGPPETQQTRSPPRARGVHIVVGLSCEPH